MEKNITIRPERVSDYQQVEDIIRQAFTTSTRQDARSTTWPTPSGPTRISAGVGPGAGAGRPCGRQYHVHEEHTGGRGREGEGHPDLWTSLYPTGTAAPGLWQAADGGVLPAGVRMGYEAIVIFGDPNNYVGRGFQSCKKHRSIWRTGTYPAAMLVKELEPGTLAGKSWIYRQSPAFVFDEAEARRFDDSLPPMEKKRLPCQEAFEILSSAVLL